MEFLFEGVLIKDANLSECGRFEVDPITYYGVAYKTALIKELIKVTNEYKIASQDETIDDLCHPIDYANAPFYILEKLGKDVEKMREEITSQHYSDYDIVWYLEIIIDRILNEYACELVDELSHKYGYESMSLDEFRMEYNFNQEEKNNMDELLKLFNQ